MNKRSHNSNSVRSSIHKLIDAPGAALQRLSSIALFNTHKLHQGKVGIIFYIGLNFFKSLLRQFFSYSSVQDLDIPSSSK
mmetsp:Transcript_7079/g.17396  ORF Transcript_7079/g.17396 Transcript_7079/m.17396 type:complete len:80 (-) Transcript_7079:609-848(-)